MKQGEERNVYLLFQKSLALSVALQSRFNSVLIKFTCIYIYYTHINTENIDIVCLIFGKKIKGALFCVFNISI